MSLGVGSECGEGHEDDGDLSDRPKQEILNNNHIDHQTDQHFKTDIRGACNNKPEMSLGVGSECGEGHEDDGDLSDRPKQEILNNNHIHHQTDQHFEIDIHGARNNKPEMSLGVGSECGEGHEDDGDLSDRLKQEILNNNHIDHQTDQHFETDIRGACNNKPGKPYEDKSQTHVDVHTDDRGTDCHQMEENHHINQTVTNVKHESNQTISNENPHTDNQPSGDQAASKKSVEVIPIQEEHETIHQEKENLKSIASKKPQSSLSHNLNTGSTNNNNELQNDIVEISKNEATDQQQTTQTVESEENNTSNMEAPRGIVSEFKIGLILLILTILVVCTIFLALPPKRNKDAFL